MLYLYYRTLGILVSENIFVIDVTTFKHLFVANTNKFRNKVKSYFQRGRAKILPNGVALIIFFKSWENFVGKVNYFRAGQSLFHSSSSVAIDWDSCFKLEQSNI